MSTTPLFLGLAIALFIGRLAAIPVIGSPISLAIFALVPAAYQISWAASGLLKGNLRIGRVLPLIVLSIVSIVLLGWLVKSGTHNEVIDFAGRSSLYQPMIDAVYLLLWLILGASVAGAELTRLRYKQLIALTVVLAVSASVFFMPRSGIFVNYAVFRENDQALSHLTYSDYIAICGFLTLSLLRGGGDGLPSRLYC